jgi:hypothetical protein
VEITTGANVVGEVITGVIGILIQHDLVAIPVPAAGVAHVAGRDAKEKAIETETVGSASAQSPPMSRTNVAEPAMLPGAFHAEASVAAIPIVTHPAVRRIIMRSVRMAGTITKPMLLAPLVFFTFFPALIVAHPFGTMLRRSIYLGTSPVAIMLSAFMVIVSPFLRVNE